MFKMKKLLLTFFLAAGLTLALPVPAPGIAPEGAVVSAAETTPSPEKLTGWFKDANGWSYVKDNVRLTGWQDIEGSRYYFTPAGYRVSGPYKIGSSIYLFRPETESTNPAALCLGSSGLVSFTSTPNVRYYLTSKKNGTVAVSKWVKSSGHYYYSNKSGTIKLGTIKVNKKRYHITKDGRMTFYGKSSFDGGYYYAAKNGVLKTGFQKINGKQYYFNKKTGKRASGVTKIGKSTYYFRSNGRMKTGWVRQAKRTKVSYYFSSGKRASGWQTIKGKKYYFDPKNDDLRVQNCWKKIGKKYYYFNASGVLQTGFFTINGNTYYTNAKGARKKGWQTVKGRRYYMDPKTFIMKTGWLTYNKNKYYLNPTRSASTYGAATTGFVKIPSSNGKKKYWHYFNSKGVMQTGWVTLNGKKYYFKKSNGRMLTGKHKIGGKVYDFGTSGAIVTKASGPWRIEVNRRSCFVVVYQGEIEMKAFVCSTAADGVSTPTGTFTILDRLRWHELDGPTWGQYCCHITSNILFHSVPNTRPYDNHSLKAAEYNKLGTMASGGCIRLTVKHAKYIYDHCKPGTKVIISDSVKRPEDIKIEQAQKIPLTQNYDPTDPNI